MENLKDILKFGANTSKIQNENEDFEQLVSFWNGTKTAISQTAFHSGYDWIKTYVDTQLDNMSFLTEEERQRNKLSLELYLSKEKQEELKHLSLNRNYRFIKISPYFNLFERINANPKQIIALCLIDLLRSNPI